MACEGVWIKINADTRGYTNRFACSNCGSHVTIGAYDTDCDYPYCPWCRCEMIETWETEDDDGQTDSLG